MEAPSLLIVQLTCHARLYPSRWSWYLVSILSLERSNHDAAVDVVVVSHDLGGTGPGPSGRLRGAKRAPGKARCARSRSGRLACGTALRPEVDEGWIVVTRGETIEAAGPAGEVKVPMPSLLIVLTIVVTRVTFIPTDRQIFYSL